MENQELPRKISTREELMTAINLAASEKIKELEEHYGKNHELKIILEATMHRIHTEQANFHNVHVGRMLDLGMNSLEDVYAIFNQRLDTHCEDLYSAAALHEAEKEKTGVHDVKKIRAGVKRSVRKAA